MNYSFKSHQSSLYVCLYHYKLIWHAIIGTLLLLMLLLPWQAHAASKETILVVGDSLSAGYGLKRNTGWVPLMQQEFDTKGLPYTIVNASISGDTTAGGRARIEAAIQKHEPTLVVIELGANDALRGLPLNNIRANLQEMIAISQKAGAKVLLLGIQIPPNYGKAYTDQFAQIYVDLASQNQVGLIPFFLSGVADSDNAEQLFQRDRIHPNEAAQPIILKNIYPVLTDMLQE